jgi:hypothetical protein
MRDTQQLTFPAPPRHIRRNLSAGCGIWFLRLFLLPHTLIGIGILLAGPARLSVYYFGAPVTAVVDRTEARRSSKHPNTFYHYAYFHYTIEGVRVDSQETSTPQRKSGATFEGKAVRIAGLNEFIPVPSSIWRESLTLMGIAIFWNGILSLFLFGAWVLPLRERWLARHGEAASGNVTHYEFNRSKGKAYWLHYAFQLPDQTRYSDKAPVTAAQRDALPPGSPLTILYNPRRPKQNLAYDVSDVTVDWT